MEEAKKPKTNNERELDIIEFWKKNNIFEKSLEKETPKGEYVFYDGPPTANGRPGIHHLEARAFKDAIPRYRTMRGYHVRRKAGWDTHGLPVELQVEKELGLTSKKQIEEYGIDKFNQKCKESVWTYIDEWEQFTGRSGYWVDLHDPYITYKSEYIESLWHILKEVENKKLLYKDYRIVPWCSRCGTALSSHELAQGYKDVKDLSVTAKFKLVGQDGVFVLAWTTTPWTLPGNVALAINPELDYVKIALNGEYLILAKDRLSVIDGEYSIQEEFKGDKLIGLEYEPLYDFLRNQIGALDAYKESAEKAFKIYPADFVTAVDGTGVVHTAVMYGQDDFELGTKLGLPKYHLVADDGKFLDNVGFLSGRFVKDEDVAVDIIKDLANRQSGSLLFKKEKYEHSYPHCWRCSTPLVYYARDSWYIRMSELRDELVMNNNFINWEPNHIGQGRFGEWIREVKDWAISRERYWGTPLPVWEDIHGNRHIFSNRDELKKHTINSGNKYTLMRHGQTMNNLNDIISASIEDDNSILTPEGINQVKASSEILKDKKIDLIYTSPFMRTQETAKIVADALGLPHANIVVDERLHEVSMGTFNGKTWSEYWDFAGDYKNHFIKPAPGGEDMSSIRKRFGEFIYEIEQTVKDKNILVINHGVGIWILESIARGLTVQESLDFRHTDQKLKDNLKNAAITEFDFKILPHNDIYELDLHRPYIDQYPLFDDNGNKLTRVKEVMDVWFDSGAMPYAQDGYPFKTDKLYVPADFICEAIDQTRGWFYTLHAVATLLGKKEAYKNVICLGHILDKDGQKMSKSKGNVVSPWEMFEKYGADTLRFWMYSVNQPGDSKNFDEKTVDEINKKVFNLIRNVYSFYELYRNRKTEVNYSLKGFSPKNPLNIWILSKLANLVDISTESLDNYSLFTPARAVREFVDDMSTWYLRRSRDLIRDGVEEYHKTLYLTLKTLSQIMAPMTPFIAEELWQNLRTNNDEESVHLSSWPESVKFAESEFVLETMSSIRALVTAGHSMRKEHNIPVRQPLKSLTVNVAVPEDYVPIICDELNVVSVIHGKEISLDTHITEELKSEGNYRELVRYIMDTRKSMGFIPKDIITIEFMGGSDAQEFIEKWQEKMLSDVSAESFVFKNNLEEKPIKIGEIDIHIKIKK